MHSSRYCVGPILCKLTAFRLLRVVAGGFLSAMAKITSSPSTESEKNNSIITWQIVFRSLPDLYFYAVVGCE